MAGGATTRLLSTCRSISRLAGLFGIFVGLTVLFGGWALDIAILRTMVPGYSPMVPQTALGLLLCGVVLWLNDVAETGQTRKLLVRVCAGIICLLGMETLMEQFVGKEFDISRLIFNPATWIAFDRMSVRSALTFVLLGGALLLTRSRRDFAVGQYLVMVAGVLCFFNAIGYLYGIEILHGLALQSRSAQMAIHTSVTLVILCAGALLSRPDWGLVSAITSSAPGGVMARRLLPAALLIPVGMGWLRWQGHQIGLYSAAFGVTLFTAINIIVFAFLILRSGQILNSLDVERARAEESMRQLADSMPQIVWTATPEGHVDYYNQRWRDYTGMTLEQTKNWGWQPVLHPDDLRNTLDRWARAFTTGEPLEAEYRFKRGSDGAYRWHLGRARPIRDSEGAVVRWIGTCTDIEDHKQAESEIKILNEDLEERVGQRTAELDRSNRQLAMANEELIAAASRLEQSNRELQDFAFVASHDLQEPLRKVQTFGDRLKTASREAMDEQGRDYLDRMLNAAKRMQALVQDLLRFARVTSHAHPFAPVDLAQVTREVLSDLEVRITETNALVEVGDLPTIDGDAIQMRQLLQNLIGNALKFHQSGRAAAVRVYGRKAEFGSTPDGMFRLVVEDQGIGFDEKHLDRIFVVFQRLHGRTEYEGTGMGLAICRKIVQRHGGHITATSTPGQGTSFVVALPFRQPDGNGTPIPDRSGNLHLGLLPANCGTSSAQGEFL